MRTQTLGNEYNLREVTTAYRTDIINKSAKDGKPFFIREVKINPELQTTSLLLKERLTGEYIHVPSRLFYTSNYTQQFKKEYPEELYELVLETNEYHRIRKTNQNWGAYILPEDAKPKERFYIPNIIEDIVSSKFRRMVLVATDGVGIFTGESFELDRSVYSNLQIVG